VICNTPGYRITVVSSRSGGSSQIAKRASRSRALSAFCGSQSTSYRPATNCIVELKSRVPRAIAYGTAEVIKPKNTPATRPVVNAPQGLGLKNPSTDEKTQPCAGDHTTAEHFRPRQPPGDPFDLHQVDTDDRHLLHWELLLGQVVDGSLRLRVGGV
jgi:hypothetical protein